MSQATPEAPKVELYTSRYCGYCMRAKTLLEQKSVVYVEYLLDEQPELRPVMIERSAGSSSVPQIFISGRHIGGCDDLYQLERRGMLDGLLGRGDQAP